MSNKKISTSITIDLDVLTQVRDLAKKEHRSVSAQIEMMLSERLGALGGVPNGKV